MESISDPRKPPPKPPKRNKIRYPSLIPIIPEELIIEILSRLPAKSLGKFKCVSRSWLSLISSRGFIKAHLATASGRDDYSHHGLIFTLHSFQPNRYNQLKQSSVGSLLYAPATAEAVDIDYPMKRTNRSFWVVGSCDGLVCIRTRKDDLFLWNPCTKESKKLPYAGIKNDWVGLGYGFGYDQLNDDYKVAALFFIVSGETFETKANVYSLKNNCWRLTEDFKIGDQMIGLGQYVSGKLHWFVSDGIDSRKIGSLDLANATYEEMDKPNHENYQYNWTLGVLGGCLSVLYYETTHADVWVMKDYGVKESWTKVVSIPYIGNPGQMFCSSDLVCMSRTGEILFVLQSVLSLYNSKSNTFMRYPQINPLLDVNMYVESLVSPNAHDGEQRQLRLRGKRKVPRS